MITPVKQKHTIYQGATYEWAYQVTDDNSVVKNLTGCSAACMARVDPSDAVPVLNLTGTITAVQGYIKFVATPAATVGKTWETAGFDVELTWPDGHIDKVAVGTMILKPEFTK